ncbi:hypothetical protein N8Z69_00140 [Candidatus Thioglobus sp.]|nr:hypothetical protein [Candidatus Thioglobus sp.]MDC1289792.1 hypothetical protein [Candidatus Thioglobus sp.]
MKKQLLLLFSILLLCSTSVISNEALIGSWQNDEGLKMDLMRGFKPNVGPVIYWEDEEVSEIQTWKVNPNSNELEIYYESGIYDISSDGNQLYWNTASWKDKEDLLWKKIDDIESKNVINIKKDSDAFVNILTSALWSSNVKKNDHKEFTKTFSSTSGILSGFNKERELDDLQSWGVASGVFTIGSSNLYVEALISDKYLIAVDANDNFLVLYKGDVTEELERITLKDSREQFLSSLTTGAWKKISSYSPDSIFRFRPIEGELKGRVFVENDSKLISSSIWEYSPATGAFKEGYTEYLSGLNIGNLLVFVDKDGKQNALYRDNSVELIEFSTSDVDNISISERSTTETKNTLNRQMSIGNGNDFTLFEFNIDNRTGYFHEWTSYPFQITGEALQIDDYYPSKFEQLYLIEDYVVFDESFSKKIDTRKSRMKPKTDIESKEDSVKAIEVLDTESKVSLKIKIDLKDGTSKTIPIPVSSLLDLKSISVITQ